MRPLKWTSKSLDKICGDLKQTVGRDERVIREYIRNQEKEDKRFDQMKLEY